MPFGLPYPRSAIQPFVIAFPLSQFALLRCTFCAVAFCVFSFLCSRLIRLPCRVFAVYILCDCVIRTSALLRLARLETLQADGLQSSQGALQKHAGIKRSGLADMNHHPIVFRGVINRESGSTWARQCARNNWIS